MAEPVTTGTAAGLTFFGAMFVSLFPGVDPAMVIGAFAGSVFSFLHANEISTLKRFGMAAVSLVLGMHAGDLTAGIITAVTPEAIIARPPLGAGIAAALSVTILHLIIDMLSDWRQLLEWIWTHIKAPFNSFKGRGE